MTRRLIQNRGVDGVLTRNASKAGAVGMLCHPSAARRFMAEQRVKRAKLRRLNSMDQNRAWGFPYGRSVRIKDENA